MVLEDIIQYALVNLSITILEQTILDIYGMERKQEVISCSSLDN